VQCPVDKEPLIALEWDELEVDYCTDCAGLWFDAGELELLLDAPDLAHLLSGESASVDPSAAKRLCPLCGARMTQHCPAGAPEVIYDTCPNGHGVWLDKGELAAIARASGSDEACGRVAAFLADLFGA